MRRHRIQTQYHKLLILDQISIENGFKSRLFQQSDVYRSSLEYYDYPYRAKPRRSWKSYRHKQYKGA